MEQLNISKALFVVKAGYRDGYGHLKRCLILADYGKSYFSSIFSIIGKVEKSVLNIPFPVIDISSIDEIQDIDIIFTDCRDTKDRFMKKLINKAPVISLDDLGPGSNRALISILSMPVLNNVKANYSGLKYFIADPSLIKIKEKGLNKKDYILVGFGGSDPYNLSEKVVKILADKGLNIILIKGPLNRWNYNFPGVKVLVNPDNIYELIKESSLFITSYGISFFESLFLNTPVILYNHSAYHYELARNFKVPNLGYPGFRDKELNNRLLFYINHIDDVKKQCSKYYNLIDGLGVNRVADIIRRVVESGRKDCLFTHKDYVVIKRNDGYSIARCNRCKDLFLMTTVRMDKKYSEGYFLDEYKKQYGKNYIEDRENIESISDRRLSIIERIYSPKENLLDVGCALGFFVNKAKMKGWDAEGVEVSKFAAKWAEENLKVKVYNGNFLDIEFNEKYSVITMFFVFEHFPDIEKVVEKVYSLLNRNGVLAIALPNRGGISYRLKKSEYLDGHPDDHYIDTTPKNMKRFLMTRGFKIKKVVSTGIHPERFFSIFGIERVPVWLGKLYYCFASLFNLGDTFEIYAIKK